MPTIFISYRRDDAAGYAGRLYEALEARLGPNRVFRDVDTLAPGQDFVEAIDARLRECRVFLALIGREWLDARDAAGHRRLDQPQDYVRLEIAGALAQPAVRVIPVLIEGAPMPAPELLPDDIRPLARRHAVSLRDDAWEHDVNRLAAAIEGGRKVAAPAGRAARWMRPIAVAAAVVLVLAAVWLGSRSPDNPTPASTQGASGQAAESAGAIVTRERAGASADRNGAADVTTSKALVVALPPVREAVQGRLIYTLLSAAVAPLDGDTSQLRLLVRFSNEGRYDANAWDSSFRLAVNGRMLAPTSRLNELASSNSQLDGLVTFTIPSDTQRAILRVLVEPPAELPLDLPPLDAARGRPLDAARDRPLDAARGRPLDEARENPGAGGESSAAITRTPVTEPRLVLRTDGGSVTVERVSSRRFVNVLRLRFTVRAANTGRYPGGFPQLRVAAGGRVIAPNESAAIVVDADSDETLDVEFDVPPDTARAVLRVSSGEEVAELPVDLQ